MGLERSSPEISAPRRASRFLIASDMITPPYKLRVCASRSSHLPPNRRKRELVKLVHSASRERGCGQQGYVSACVNPDQNETPLALIGPSHFLISAARNCARYCGERRSGAITSPPTCLRCCCKDGISSAAIVARLSLWMIGCGVFAGRKSAYQLGRSKLVSPCSCAEGRSGRFDDRVLLRIAIGLTVLPAICGSARGRLTQS